MAALDKFSGREDDPSKKKADFSNVRSGSSSTAPDASLERKPVTEPGGKTYTVVAGDSLSKIAQREYGDANEWKKIYEANKHMIQNPDLLYPGQELTLP